MDKFSRYENRQVKNERIGCMKGQKKPDDSRKKEPSGFDAVQSSRHFVHWSEVKGSPSAC